MSIVGNIIKPIVGNIVGGIVGGVTDPNANLAWSAGLSEYQRSGANATDADFELSAQIDGVGTPVFTVPATLALPDWEGVSRTVEVANVAPWYGSRVVTNLSTYSSALTNAVWQVNGAVKVDDSTFSVSSNLNRFYQFHNSVAGDDFTITATITSDVDCSFNMYVYDGSAIQSPTISLVAGVPVRVSFSGTFANTLTNAQIQFFRYASAIPATITMVNCQYENVTGQTNQAPADYIETTTAAVTKHYANQNGNTVSGNVITEAVGTALATMPSLFAAPAGTWDGIVVDSHILISYDVNNHADNQGAYYCEYTPLAEANNGIIVISGSAQIAHEFSNKARSYDGAYAQNSGVALTANIAHKIGHSYDSTEALRALNVEGTSGESSYSGHWTGTQINLISSPSGGNPTSPCLIRNIRRYDLDYADAKAKIAELML